MLSKIVEYTNYIYDYFGSEDNSKKDDDYLLSQIKADRFPLDSVLESLLSTPMQDSHTEIDCSTIQIDKKVLLKKINNPLPIKEQNPDQMPKRKDALSTAVSCVVIGKVILKQIAIEELVYYNDLRNTKIIFAGCSRVFWFCGEVPKQKFQIGNIVGADVSFSDTNGHIQAWITTLSKRRTLK